MQTNLQKGLDTFTLITNDLLVKIISGEICAKTLALKELSNRGYNIEGQWIGFEQAAKQILNNNK